MKTAHICEGFGIMCAIHGGAISHLHAACAIYNSKYFERLVPETYYSPPGIRDASTEIDSDGYAHPWDQPRARIRSRLGLGEVSIRSAWNRDSRVKMRDFSSLLRIPMVLAVNSPIDPRNESEYGKDPQDSAHRYGHALDKPHLPLFEPRRDENSGRSRPTSRPCRGKMCALRRFALH